jgi:hypothetical protein
LRIYLSNEESHIEQVVRYQCGSVMLDITGSAFITAYVASIVIVAIHQARATGTVRPLILGLLIWSAAQAALLAASRTLVPAHIQPNLLMFGLSLAVLGIAWTLLRGFRQTAAATPLTPLIALHIWRLGGFFFLLLYTQGRLPSPFAPVAAVGDMITGAGAAALVIATLHGKQPSRHLVGAWNAFGLGDLIVAVALALLSTPGTAFQLFTNVPARSAFTTLPWILVPAAIVPALFFVHFAIFLKLKQDRESASNPSLAL